MIGGIRATLNSIGLLFLRVTIGFMMAVGHGWPKLQNFEQYSAMFPPMFGLGQKQTLMLAIFGELVCPALVALGLLTRLAALSTAITMVVAVSVAHMADPLFMSGAMVVTTTDKKVHTGFVASEDERQVVVATAEGSVTIPRTEVVSQKPQGTKEPAILFLIPFAALIFMGPGRFSIDGLIFCRKKPEAPSAPSMRPL